MNSADFELFSTLRHWHEQGYDAALATVTHTYGSSPRPAGSMAAVRADGAVAGSVSGGCIEADLIERVRRGVPALPQRLRYGGTREENQRVGLPCGGQLELVVERMPDLSVVEDLLQALRARLPVARRLDLMSGVSTLFTPDGTPALVCDEKELVSPHNPCWRLLLIGAVETARYLADMAQTLGYEVLVCDPRAEYAVTWNAAHGALVGGMPDDAVLALHPDGRTAIVALTHDPKLDDMALMEALRSEAFYVGALGSRSNQSARRERLASLDLAAREIDRLRGPVGLPIGSRLPAEIAVAILADLIAVKNGIELFAVERQSFSTLRCVGA